MTIASDPRDFAFQMRIMGGALEGQNVDFTALLCEDPRDEYVEKWRDLHAWEFKREFGKNPRLRYRYALPAARKVKR